MKRLMFVLVSVLVLAWATMNRWDRLKSGSYIVDSSANQSAFFQKYNPELVIKRFRNDAGYQEMGGRGADPGIRSIHHHAEFDQMFTIQADRKGDLTQAIREDIQSWFRTTGTRLTGGQQESNGGFTFKYVAGNSIGLISVQPPVHNDGVHRQFQLEAGLDDIIVKIGLEETWTRPASETRW